MADFCTVPDLEALLQVEISTATQLASAERAITAAAAAIRNYCHQFIELVEDEAITLDVPAGRSQLFLPELPVVEVASVVEDGETLTATDDFILGQHGVLYRVDRRWKSGVQVVTVTYSHGHATIPDDVQDVATRAAARAYQAGLKSADSAGIAGVASKQLGDYAVAFMAEAGGGIGEGVMGVSGARMLLLSEKDMLARYRYVAL